MTQRGKFHVGTSGWGFIERERRFYPTGIIRGGKLGYYAGVFDCLEVNTTFYRMHKAATFQKWADSVPDNFQFTFKMWGEVTHTKGFTVNPAFIDEFMQAIANIGDKRGPILIQLPPRLTAANKEGLQTILRQVKQNDPDNSWPIAVELRNPLWYTDEVRAMLDQFRVALVLHDMPKSANWTPNENNDFAYFRFHGEKGDYRGGYTDYFLRGKALMIVALLKQGKDVYAYFNNTMGDAPFNALTLQKFVEELNG